MNNEFIRGHRLENYICDDLILNDVSFDEICAAFQCKKK